MSALLGRQAARDACWSAAERRQGRHAHLAARPPQPQQSAPHLRAPAGSGAATLEAPPPPQIPRTLSEVDNGKLLGFGADLAEDHPGYKDAGYKQRRQEIGQLARAHEVGEPIPYLEYTPEEVRVWGTVLKELRQLYPSHACKEYLGSFPLFDFKEDRVPQLEDMADILRQTTGWQIRPVAGLLHPRDFLNGLAFKCFHSTQYIRHSSRPNYTPEPDLVHEILGHVPMLANPAFCDMVHQIGLASLGADESQIWHLTKIYWYTVEFGVVREGKDIKAFGAGVLSSFGELKHMASGQPAMEPFDPFMKQPKMSYKDGYQKRYFVLDSFEDGASKLRDYCASVTSPELITEWTAHQQP